MHVYLIKASGVIEQIRKIYGILGTHGKSDEFSQQRKEFSHFVFVFYAIEFHIIVSNQIIDQKEVLDSSYVVNLFWLYILQKFAQYFRGDLIL